MFLYSSLKGRLFLTNNHSDSKVVTYPTPFVPGLSWKERIERCEFNHVEKGLLRRIGKFVDIENEDPSLLDIELYCPGSSIRSIGIESFLRKNGKEIISPARFLHFLETHADITLHELNPADDPAVVCTRKVYVGWQHKVYVLKAYISDWYRSLRLSPRDEIWPDTYRFASAHKLCWYPDIGQPPKS